MISLLPKIFHKSRTSTTHCSQSPWIYNNWPNWVCTWLSSGPHLFNCACTGVSKAWQHITLSKQWPSADCLSLWHHYVQRRGRLSSWGSALFSGQKRADSVANVSNQALCGLLFVLGKGAGKELFSGEGQRKTKLQKQPQAIFYQPWPLESTMFSAAGRR